MLEFTHGFRFDLPDTFAGHFEDAAHFFERVYVTVADAKAPLHDLTPRLPIHFADVYGGAKFTPCHVLGRPPAKSAARKCGAFRLSGGLANHAPRSFSWLNRPLGTNDWQPYRE